MADTAETDAEMRYLLGNLTESEKARVEEDYFADDSKFEAFEIAEDDLIDAYIRKELSSADQLLFETNLLSLPRIRARVDFAKTLALKVNSVWLTEPEASIEPARSFRAPLTESKTPWWKQIFVTQPSFGIAMAASAVLILVASVVLVTGWLRLKNESEQLAADRSALQRQQEALDKLSADQRTSSEQSRAELQRAADQLAEQRRLFVEFQTQKRESGPQSILGTVTSILLSPGSVRSGGGDPPELRLRPGTSAVQLKLELQNNDYRSYSVSVNTPDGNVVYHHSSLRPRTSKQGPLLIFSIPTSKLPPDDYTVEIEGHTASGQRDPLQSYPFRVLPSK